MKFLPNTSREYPLRFFIYWLIIWALLFLYSTVIMLPKISGNGYTVRKDVCLEEGTTGRFDEYTECIDYGDPYYVPVGRELINNFKNYGIGSFLVILIIGWFLRNGKKSEERKNKKPFNEILTDRRIINFLSCVAPKKGEEHYDEYQEFYRRLNKGKPLEEIFGKDKDGSRCFLIVRKKPKDFYEIEFGSGWGEIESAEWQGCGSSRTWQVTFDENDSAICGDEIDMTFYD